MGKSILSTFENLYLLFSSFNFGIKFSLWVSEVQKKEKQEKGNINTLCRYSYCSCESPSDLCVQWDNSRISGSRAADSITSGRCLFSKWRNPLETCWRKTLDLRHLLVAHMMTSREKSSLIIMKYCQYLKTKTYFLCRSLLNSNFPSQSPRYRKTKKKEIEKLKTLSRWLGISHYL